MKTVLFLLSMFCATGALAQNTGGVGVLSSEVQKWDMVSHDNHASITPLAQEQNLMSYSTPIRARGERPLWEVGQVKEEPSLGEVARSQRKLHAADKKAPVVWHN